MTSKKIVFLSCFLKCDTFHTDILTIPKSKMIVDDDDKCNIGIKNSTSSTSDSSQCKNRFSTAVCLLAVPALILLVTVLDGLFWFKNGFISTHVECKIYQYVSSELFR